MAKIKAPTSRGGRASDGKGKTLYKDGVAFPDYPGYEAVYEWAYETERGEFTGNRDGFTPRGYVSAVKESPEGGAADRTKFEERFGTPPPPAPAKTAANAAVRSGRKPASSRSSSVSPNVPPANVRYQQGTPGKKGSSSTTGTAGRAGIGTAGKAGTSKPGMAKKGKAGTAGKSGTSGKAGTSGSKGAQGASGSKGSTSVTIGGKKYTSTNGKTKISYTQTTHNGVTTTTFK